MDFSHFPPTAELIEDLELLKHPEGGYFAETDRQEQTVPSPFANGELRPLSTTIYYLLTHDSPNGYIHMNKSATMHVLHHGRTEYTLIHPPTANTPARVERVVLGPNTRAGEVRQLLVGTSVWKMSRLLPEDLKAADKEKVGCLISEVVFPGFHWEDHAYLKPGQLEGLLEGVQGGEEWVKELQGFVKS